MSRKTLILTGGLLVLTGALVAAVYGLSNNTSTTVTPSEYLGVAPKVVVDQGEPDTPRVSPSDPSDLEPDSDVSAESVYWEDLEASQLLWNSIRETHPWASTLPHISSHFTVYYGGSVSEPGVEIILESKTQQEYNEYREESLAWLRSVGAPVDSMRIATRYRGQKRLPQP